MHHRIFALVPAAGSGSRAQSAIPKQYVPIRGTPMLVHTIQALAAVASIRKTLIVVSPDDTLLSASVPATAWPEHVSVSRQGGSSRAHTVCNGLHALLQMGANLQDWVLVHDAARCLITPGLLVRLIEAGRQDAVGAILALPLADTLKESDVPEPDTPPRIQHTVDRNRKWLAQTPQMFRIGLLLQALESSLTTDGSGVTDEASAVERMGLHPLLVPGSAQNFKVTYPEDFALAEAVIALREQAQAQAT